MKSNKNIFAVVVLLLALALIIGGFIAFLNNESLGEAAIVLGFVIYLFYRLRSSSN